MTDQRIKKAFGLLKKNGIDTFVATEINHVHYLSGFTGSNGIVVISPPKAYFLTDFRYGLQAQKEVKNCKIVIANRQLITELPKLPVFSKGTRVGVEGDFISLNMLEKLKELLPQVVFRPTSQLVESLSVVKDGDEIGKIRKAVRIADKAFSEILDELKPGVKEKDIALEIEYKMRILGAENASFETIVASGQRSAMPHGRASDKKLRKGDYVTLDFGCLYQGYASDITRTVVLGKATEKQKKIYDIVLTAQKAACRAVRPGMACSRLDSVARDIIMKAGYGDNFGHGLGHGIGLIVHDRPVLSPQSNDVLEPGMVVTIEPGIYISNWGGVRIEDDVLVTTNGGQILSKLPKELVEL
ncbi:MAG: Xaa-Pro dipeptidase [candidate division Zixibacteria bacterium RBG_16_53_22]|nr:MAG: Xaa-Pro dipeptidase [candidate division Zixibacteria bacterium RBG_16_53_22]